jgi:hypothetical protein
MPYQPPFDLLVQIAVIRESVANLLMLRRNVVACGIGLKITGGQVTNMPSIIVSVREKEPRTALSASDLIPSMIDNIPTDVVETGPITALGLDRQQAVRPIRPGASIGHRDSTAGTLGAIVRRDSQRYLLGNNHVLAMLNAAQIGDPIFQPGPSDGGTLDDAIAKLAGFELIRFSGEASAAPAIINTPTAQPQGCAALIASLFNRQPTAPIPTPIPTTNPTFPENRVDAAIAIPNEGVATNSAILDLNFAPVGVADPRLGMSVVKSGRTTGLTSGMITQVDVTVDVDYGGKRARYVNQMVITPFSQRGDSGSLVLNADRQAVGLIFSGSDVISIASPIRFVLAAMRAELVTS